jgi:penicillin-binding protein 2
VNDTFLAPKPDRDRRPLRFVTFGVVTILMFSLLTLRLGYLQISNNQTYVAKAEQQSTAKVEVPAPRGLIYDRSGQLLVANVATFAVKITPSELPYSRRDEVAQRLAGLLGLDATEILTTIDSAPGSRFDPVRIAQDVPEETARLVQESSDALPGVHVSVETRREYPDGALLAHILGYTGPIDAATYARLKATGYLPDDLIGKAGIEASFEKELRGTYGEDLVERDATGKQGQVLSTIQNPVPGASLVLTIDRQVQKEATQALKWGMKAAGLKRGVFIVMNPQTGEVLAMVSLPSYDNNLFSRGISAKAFQKLVNDKNKPLTNHAVQAHFPPGSTFKLVTGTGGVQDKKIKPSTLIRTRGFLVLSGVRYYDWNHAGFGLCNLNCGFGQKTGIDLPGEVPGIIPSNTWKMNALGQPMFGGEVYQAGIGQGYDMVTPIQLINAYAAMANGGKLYRPQLVREVKGPDGSVIQPFKPDLIRKLPVSQATLRAMRLAARSVVTLRHTYNLVDMPVKVAGKSGTAEFGERDAKGRLPYHSWFVGFVPKNPYKADFARTDSQLVFLAFAYDSRTKGNAGTEIAKAFLQLHYHIKKDYLNRDLLKRGNFYQSN